MLIRFRLLAPVLGTLVALTLLPAGGVTASAAGAPLVGHQPIFAPNSHLSSGRVAQRAQDAPVPGSSGLPGPPNPSNNLPYKGGKVMHNPTAFTVFWLPSGHYEAAATAATDTRFENLQNRFFGDIGGSQFFSVVSQYTDGSGAPGSSVTLGGTVVDTTNKYPHAGTQADPLLDGDIQAEVTRMVNQQHWTQDTNHIVLVYTARGIQECFKSDGECTFVNKAHGQTDAFCAYHFNYSNGGKDGIYSFMGDNDLGAGCGPGGTGPNSDNEADNQVSVTSHEFIEAVTDPDIDAWVGPTDTDEIGDKCNAQASPQNAAHADVYMASNPYLIQMEWSNVVSTCAMSRCASSMCPTAPTVQKTADATVTTGQTFNVSIKVRNPSDTDADSKVTVTDTLPNGATYVSGSASPGPASVNGQQITWNLNTVAVHDQPAITFQAIAGADLQNGAVLHNCATVSWADMLGNVQGSQPSSCADTTAVNQPPTLLLPGDQTGDFNDPLSFTISATDAEAGDTLTFSASGLPAGLTLTDNGDRTATVSGTIAAAPGTYPVTFSVSDAHNPPVTGTLDVIVTREETALTYTGDTTGDFHDPATMSARLTDPDGGAPIAGKVLTFTLGAGDTCTTAPTDGSGSASCVITPTQAAATVPLTVSFAGDTFFLPSSRTVSFVITREETTTIYTGPARVANGEPVTLSGVLREDGVTPIAGRPLTMTLGSGASAQVCTTGPTDAGGAASCTIASVSQPLNAGATVPITAAFAGDAFYLPSAGTATLRLQFMTGRAFGLSANVSALLPLVSISPTPDTGQVRTASAASTNTPCVASVSTLAVSAHSLCANVTTTLAPGTSTATASVADVTIGLPGLPVIAISGLKAVSHSACGSTSGSTTLTLTIGGVPVTTSLAPNSVIDLGAAKLVLNEQKPVPGADSGLTVNAVHLIVSGLVVNGDIVVGSATSDMHNCF